MLKYIIDKIGFDESFLKYWDNLKVINSSNIHIITTVQTFFQNFTYSLNPFHEEFASERKNFEVFIKIILPLKYISILKADIYSWCLYLGMLPPEMDEKIFRESIPLITSNFPKEYLSSSWGYLPAIFLKTIISQQWPVTQALVDSFNGILKHIQAETATMRNLIHLEASISVFLEYFIPKTEEEKRAGNIFINIILKWLLDLSKLHFNCHNFETATDIVKRLLTSSLCKGASVILFGTLKKFTDILCSHHSPQNQNTQRLLLIVFDMTTNPQSKIDPQSQTLLQPIIYYICEKILSNIGTLVLEKDYFCLEQLLSPADNPSPLFQTDQIQHLKQLLITLNPGTLVTVQSPKQDIPN
jgi:hypothetical protein